MSEFLIGIWQGFIVPITFLISLFDHDVNIYNAQNSRNWYNFGYVLGLSATFSIGWLR